MVLCLMLQIATAATPDPLGIAITPLQLVDVPPELGGYAEDRLANRLGDLGFKVTTAADIAALLGLDRQRQLLGCADESACSSEIGSALGVPLMLTGRVSKLEDRFDIDLRILRQRDGLVVARDTRRIVGLKGLGELMEAAGDSLAKQLEPKTPFAWRLWVPLLAGTVAAGVGGTLWAQAELQHASYTGAGSVPVTSIRGLGNIDAKFAQLSTQRLVGMVVAGAGVALIAGGVVWNALVPSLPVSVVVAPHGGGAAFALGGTF